MRRRALTPHVSATSVAVRGFHVKSAESRELLETVGRSFLTGYACAAEARSPAEAEEVLEAQPERFRGFAYEGAAMACAVIDALPFSRGRRTAGLLAGRGGDHIYMAYVGIGWALARLPRFRWPDLSALDPLLRWLVLDGYGFHQAYFHTGTYVHRHVRPSISWPEGRYRPYVDRAVDQGIGRALWFVGGTDADRVAMMIERFAEPRRCDLYSGAALAATYAGGASGAELRALRERAEPYRHFLAQASAFAAKARARAGLVVPHTGVATDVFCGMTPDEAVRVSDTAQPGPEEASGRSGDPAEPAYEIWRRRIATEFAAAKGAGR
nr:DUF1702 family protein [Haloechinothrix aidingensis]